MAGHRLSASADCCTCGRYGNFMLKRPFTQPALWGGSGSNLHVALFWSGSSALYYISMSGFPAAFCWCSSKILPDCQGLTWIPRPG